MKLNLVKASVLASVAGLALAALAGCAAPGPAAAPAATLAKACIDPVSIARQTIVSDQEIRFAMNNGDVWVNRLPRPCSGLKIEGGFGWDVRGRQVCSNEQTIRVLNSGVTCLLGEFSRAPA